MPQRGPEASQRISLAIFIRRTGERFECAGRENDFVVCRQCGEFVRVSAKRQTRQIGDLFGGAFRKFGMRVETRADGSSADCQIVKSVQNLF